MQGRKWDFYKANLLNKAKLFAQQPSYILFYLDRFRKYSSTSAFEAFIISYPKSGRTWLQKMMIEAVKIEKGVNIDIADISALNKYVDDFPNLLSTHAGSSWEEIVKNHDEIKVDDIEAYSHAKIIFLHRDPRDVLVSQYYHILHRSGYPSFDRDYLIDNSNVGLLKIIAFMNKWAEYVLAHPNKILPIAYHALKEDPKIYLIKILDLINYPVSTTHISEAIENSTLSKMRQAERADADNPWANTSSKGADNPNSFHSRKGITGEYKTFFASEEIEKINRIIKSELSSYYSHYF